MGFRYLGLWLAALLQGCSLVQSQPQVTGVWSATFELPMVAAAMANLPDGKVLMWAAYSQTAYESPGVNKGQTWTTIWDPENPESATARLIDTTGHDSKWYLIDAENEYPDWWLPQCFALGRASFRTDV